MDKNKVFSLYIHIPFCVSKCSYCDFFSKEYHSFCKNEDKTFFFDKYICAIINEIKQRVNSFGFCTCKSVYIGGGTPSILSKENLSKLCNELNKILIFEKDYEFTIEVNPDDVNKSYVDFLNTLSINRISCGLQSLDDKVLKFVNRRANKKQNLSAVKNINKYWKGQSSFDFICGLPFEKKYSFIKNIKKVCKFKPDHISVYSLCVEPDTKLGKLINENKIKYDFDKTDKMWIKTKNILNKMGFVQYEVSNFCLPGKESKHNLTYWNHQDYLGVGSGATGTVYNNDGSGFRWTNTKNINEYIDFWTNQQNVLKNQECKKEDIEFIDVETSKFEFFMMGLRKKEGITESEYQQIFGTNLSLKFKSYFSDWENKHLALKENDNETIRYSLNENGLLFLNQFLENMEF